MLFLMVFFLERVFEYSLVKTNEYSKPEKWHSGQPYEDPIRTIKVENHSLCFGLFCKTALETPGYWLGICRPNTNTHRTKNSVGNLTLILTSTKFTRQTMPDCKGGTK